MYMYLWYARLGPITERIKFSYILLFSILFLALRRYVLFEYKTFALKKLSEALQFLE